MRAWLGTACALLAIIGVNPGASDAGSRGRGVRVPWGGVVAGTHPGIASSPADRAWDLLRSIDDATLLVHVREGGDLRRDGNARAIPEALAGLARFGALRESWRELARALEMSEGEAFDRLLGRSAGVAIINGGMAWIVVSEIDARTGERVRERLRATPKAAAAGVPILAIESGRVHAALMESAGGHLLLLGSSGDEGLYARVIERARDEERMGGEGVAAGVRVRLRDWPEAGAVLLAEATASGDGWGVRASLDSARAREIVGALPRAQAWRPATMQVEGAIAGVMGVLPRRQIEGMLGSIGSVRVRDDRPGLEAFGALSAAIMSLDEGLEVCAAVEMERGSADRGDALAQVVLGRLQRGRAGVEAFDGLAPTAMRVVRLRGLEPMRRGESLGAWTYRGPDAQGRTWMLGMVGGLGAHEDRAVAGALERIEALARMLSEEGTGEAREYLLSGWVRVGRIMGMAGGLDGAGEIVEGVSGAGVTAIARALAGVDRVSMSVWEEDGRLEGEGKIVWAR